MQAEALLPTNADVWCVRVSFSNIFQACVCQARRWSQEDADARVWRHCLPHRTRLLRRRIDGISHEHARGSAAGACGEEGLGGGGGVSSTSTAAGSSGARESPPSRRSGRGRFVKARKALRGRACLRNAKPLVSTSVRGQWTQSQFCMHRWLMCCLQ